MRILHVTPYFYPALAFGGPPKAVYEIAKRQAKAGHQVSVLTTTAFEKNETLASGSFKLDDITVYRVNNVSNSLLWKYHFSTPIGAHSILQKEKFDTVHLHEVRTLLNIVTIIFSKGKTGI